MASCLGGRDQQIGGEVSRIDVVLLGLQTLLGQVGVNGLDDFDILGRGQHRLDLRDDVHLGVRIAAFGQMGAIADPDFLVVPGIPGVHIIRRANTAFSRRQVAGLPHTDDRRVAGGVNVVLLDPDLAQHLEAGRSAHRLGGRRRQRRGQQPVAIDPDLLRQRLAFLAGLRQMEGVETPTIAFVPVGLRHGHQPVRRHERQFIQCMAQAFADQFEPIELADDRHDVRRVGALATTGFHQAPRLKQLQLRGE